MKKTYSQYKSIIRNPDRSSELAARAVEMRRSMTPAEKILWERLRASRLCGFHFRRQQVIEPYIVDFYCHSAGLVIEVDGGIHQVQEERDQQRDRNLEALGLRVIRFTNIEVEQELPLVLEAILEACNEAEEKS